ncbi:hypothetical protein MGR01S_26560 [Meiothermus granaticius NBRC 107808]|nr:hypothetical protein MGR01S_26560 [Meiothermus granaticius NBRC 107808]
MRNDALAMECCPRTGRSGRLYKNLAAARKGSTLRRAAIPIRDFPGTTVYHCHIVEHEDRGMMGILRVEGS